MKWTSVRPELLDKDSAGWFYSESCAPRLCIPVEISDEWSCSGLGLGLVPFNTVVGRTGSRTERTRRRFADDTELCAAVGTAEGREGIQRDLEGPARWPCANLMMSNKAKHKVLQLGQGKPHHQIRPAEPHLIHIPYCFQASGLHCFPGQLIPMLGPPLHHKFFLIFNLNLPRHNVRPVLPFVT